MTDERAVDMGNVPAKKLGKAEAEELARLEVVIDEAFASVADAVEAQKRGLLALVRVKDQRLYRATHPSFEAYVLARHGKSLSTAKRWIEQGRALLEMGEGAGQGGPPRPIPAQRALDRAKAPKVVDTTAMRLDQRGQGIIEPETSQQGEDVDDGAGRDHSGSPADSPGAVATTREVAEAPSESEPDTREQHPDPAQGTKTAGTPEQSDPVSPLKAFVASWKLTLGALERVPATDHTPKVWRALQQSIQDSAAELITRKIDENMEAAR